MSRVEDPVSGQIEAEGQDKSDQEGVTEDKELLVESGSGAEDDISQKSIDFASKFQVLRAAVTRKLGTANIFQTADSLYETLYGDMGPEGIISEYGIANTERYPEAISKLRSIVSFEVEEGVLPDKKSFINVVRDAMTKHVDFEEALVGGAKETIDNLAKIGPIRIWTDGDTIGIPSLGLPGSMEQHKKIAVSGFGVLRRSLARNVPENQGDINRIGNDILAVRASEHKMDMLEGIVDEFAGRGIKTVVVIDDRVDKLSDAINYLKNNSSWLVIPILVKRGEYKTKEGIDQQIVSVDSIADVTDVLSNMHINRDSGVIFLVDFDGVLMDDKVRQYLQNSAAYRELRQKGFVI